MLGKARWLELCDQGIIRPYVFVRGENRIPNRGSLHRVDWFPWAPVYKDPLHLDEVGFAEDIYLLENKAFGQAGMPMPRWVFYDCAVMPGFVAGFAMKTEALPANVRKLFESHPTKSTEWTPLSLFIIIPTMKKGEWVAHNLCTVNSLLPEQDRYYALGFLSKAFGLWYANVETCCGMTQWGSPALKLHSHYGELEVLTAYTPVHTHATTVTYRSRVKVATWVRFFTREEDMAFLEKFRPSGFSIDPSSVASMQAAQLRLQNGDGPYYLYEHELAHKGTHEPLTLYTLKGNE